ncbi:MAG TPA: hypothetical protein PLC76_05770 [Saprospiraceae bacterium]|jgi:hypothetical protein|nr:hypothetical protein [Candidatus Parvibacillus calidus]MBX2936737.1 hypothetical protein [Saprospiraceae bacterium]MBX7178470.1 hypothetical protein [Saprospiraceae bacterium]MCB0589988.1 hypothetical protein [Saprospiraceae bacterium]MCO5282774.1 hypothetical protein [Saprospiraceae bacterium]
MVFCKRLIYIIVLCHILVVSAISQEKTSKARSALLIHLDYGFNLPAADLAKRFGSNFQVGGDVEYKFPVDIFIGVNYSYLWGKKVKENIGENLFNAKNEIVGIDNHLANLVIRERGFSSSLNVGKLFRIFPNEAAALKVGIGGGFLQHKVRIVDDYGVVPQITGDYLKGYDRLTNGFMTRQYIGYQYLSTNRKINFSVGFVFAQGFTRSARGFNYDTGKKDTEKRFDLLNGLQVSWILPIYFNDYSEEIIY